MTDSNLFQEEDDPDIKEDPTLNVDNLLANQLDRLHFTQRNAIFEEIHGVATMAVEETPELLADSLVQLKTELDAMDEKTRNSYDIVSRQESNNYSQNFVNSNDFLLRFLRCELFDPHKAAVRLVSFFNFLKEVYGEDALQYFDGSMNFFTGSPEVYPGFRKGYTQMLPFRDRSGRKVIVMNSDASLLEDSVRLKTFLQMTFAAAEDKETQRNGLVLVFWPGHKKMQPPSFEYRMTVSRMLKAIPVRWASFHLCFLPTRISKVLQFLFTLSVVRGGTIGRVRIYTGEHVELQYQLMGYGIPVNLIPTTGTGVLKTKVFDQWIKSRDGLDALRRDGQDTSEIMEVPGVNDVIFRTAGKNTIFNPGNTTFRGIFERYHDKHTLSSQTEKRDLVWKILEEVESRNGRFLKWDNKGWWVVMKDRALIRKKIAISLQGYNKKRRAESNRQTVNKHELGQQDGNQDSTRANPKGNFDCNPIPEFCETFISEDRPKRKRLDSWNLTSEGSRNNF